MATYRYGVVRSRIAASQLVAGAGVSGSSPLVASLVCLQISQKVKSYGYERQGSGSSRFSKVEP